MNETMERQIRQLRLKGLGYKSIGLAVGTSKENVRYYCRKHGLDGRADLAALNFEERKNNPDVCKHCGAKIIRNRYSGKKLFCTDRCRRRWWADHPEKSNKSKEATYEYECAFCKRKFLAYGNSKRKYCCHECYIQDRFWTSQDVAITEGEIKRRQELAEQFVIPGKATQLQDKKIS